MYFLDGPRAALPDKDAKGNDLMRLKIAKDANGAPIVRSHDVVACSIGSAITRSSRKWPLSQARSSARR